MGTKRTRKWHKKLTIREIEHVNEWCGGTLAGIKTSRIIQKRDKELYPGSPEPCWTCRTVAKKTWL